MFCSSEHGPFLDINEPMTFPLGAFSQVVLYEAGALEHLVENED